MAEASIGRMTIAIDCIGYLSSSVGGSFPLMMTNQMTEIAQPGPTTCRAGSGQGRYWPGIGSDSVSPCQKMFTIHQRVPSNMS